MMKIDEYKKNRISELKSRLDEIIKIVGLHAHEAINERNDEFALRLKEKNIDIMKQYYEEMVAIKKEIAKLEGSKSIFETLDE